MAGAEHASFPEIGSRAVSKKVEDEANSYLQRIYSHPQQNNLSRLGGMGEPPPRTPAIRCWWPSAMICRGLISVPSSTGWPRSSDLTKVSFVYCAAADCAMQNDWRRVELEVSACVAVHTTFRIAGCEGCLLSPSHVVSCDQILPIGVKSSTSKQLPLEEQPELTLVLR